MLVDSCVFIDFLRGAATAESKRLSRELDAGDSAVCLCDLVYIEVLCGFPKSDATRYAKAKAFLDSLEHLELLNPDAVVANARELRARGTRLRGLKGGLVDLVIAQTAMDNGETLLTSNRADFGKIARVCDLNLWEDPDGP